MVPEGLVRVAPQPEKKSKRESCQALAWALNAFMADSGTVKKLP